MARYHMTWEHPKKCGNTFVDGDLIDCYVTISNSVYPLKDVTEIIITQVDVVKKGTMFDGSVVEKPT